MFDVEIKSFIRKPKKLAWGNFKGNSDSEKRQSKEFLEDFHILKKRW